MDKTDNNALTNQPATHAFPPPLSSPVVGCWGVGADTVFDELQPAEVDELEIFVFGRVGDLRANTEKTEAAMTPPGESVLTLGVVVSSAARGRLKSRPLIVEKQPTKVLTMMASW